MELLLINHPLDCPICDKGGECPLQNQAMSNGRADSRFIEKKRTFPKPIAISSNVLLDRERCVLCQRCTRFSEQIAGDPFIDLLERGANQQIGTSEEQPFQSYFSGNTVQICPVGALTGASYRFRARPFDLRSTDSVCEHCSSGCSLRVDWRRSKVTRRLVRRRSRGQRGVELRQGPLGVPLRRAVRPAARAAGARRVRTSSSRRRGRRRSRPPPTGCARAAGRVGVLPGGRLTEEDAYAYSKFARLALGTNDIDFRARPLSAEETAFLAEHVAGATPQRVSYAVAGEGAGSAARRLRARGRVADRLPAAAQGRAQARHQGRRGRPVRCRTARRKLDGLLVQTLPGDEADRARRRSTPW